MSVDDVEAAVRAAQAEIDADRLVELCCSIVDIPSPTGDEGTLAAWLADRLTESGLDGRVQQLDDLQANAWGRLRGTGDGPTLMLYAPIDTLTVGTAAEDLPQAGSTLRPDMLAQSIVSDGLISGLGAMNPKGHAAAILAATEAIASAGTVLKGDIIAAFGAGGMPTNARPVEGRSRRNTGQGVGCAFLLEQGVWADAAVIAKSGWGVSWEEVGLAWLDIFVGGIHTYVGARHRLPYRNPIADAATVITHLERWFPTYAERHSSGLVEPQGVVAEVESGWSRTASFVPAVARVRVDLRLAPGQSPLDAHRELEASLDELRRRDGDLDVTSELVLGIPALRTDPEHWLCSTAVRAWETETGDSHRPLDGMSGATDANILRQWGLPTVRVGLPKVHRDGVELDFTAGMNTVSIEALVTLTQYLVRVAVTSTMMDRSDLETGRRLGEHNS